MRPSRRALVLGLLASVAAPGSLFAQAAARAHRVAIVLNGSPETHQAYYDAFLEGMNRLGYRLGRSLLLEDRWVAGRLDRLGEIIGELLSLQPDVLVVAGSQAVRAAKAATSAVPIVMFAGDPVAQGVIESLARPGGNLTGLSIPPEALMSRILEKLHQIVPKASRVAVLANPSNPVHPLLWKQTQATARTLGVSVQRFDASNFHQLEIGLAAIAKQRPQALVVGADALFNSFRGYIVKFALANRLPSGHFFREAAAEGALMSYSSSLDEGYYRLANYVDRVLKGAQPREMPVEQLEIFELVINVRTARALGIALSQPVIESTNEFIDSSGQARLPYRPGWR